MTMPEPGRQAAHVLLDAVSVYRESDQGTDPMNLAFQRLNEVGAISARLDDNDELDLDLSHLLGGASTLIQWLVTQLSQCARVDREQVIADAREFLDENHDE